ncbi:putative lipoyltransferase 2, mitochondrial [Cephus cinctus]|uniref:Octanoyl-[acyl-carrier-protein]:protein N-octanoyltransferase LIPT2, mitochondrial n=1 Tax=Cephus cinctus TaxID=211228 RepID=A0AAJ7FKF2_CEPCN|nr:putative lipoyltransferase 2, mitochondrial [Cephus cinctus]
MSEKVVKVLWAGRLGYGVGLRLQKALTSHHNDTNLNMAVRNTLVLVEHNPVYTIGIRTTGYTQEDEDKLRKLGAEYYKTNRGGLITFHGPGQLVAYPIIDLRQFKASVRWYVCRIEKMIIRLCAEFGLRGQTSPDTGVWIEDKKICAIGIHGSRYITTHGLALNCNTDLTWFEHIVPCGIKGKGVTSITKELNAEVTVEEVIPIFKNAFKDEFQCSLIEYPAGEASQLLRTATKEEVLKSS